ncbi:hypothetical protein M405DRAFT_869933, partial [Rhizopogon salebrosus TDB-379]
EEEEEEEEEVEEDLDDREWREEGHSEGGAEQEGGGDGLGDGGDDGGVNVPHGSWKRRPNHVHTLSVEDASLASVAARCKGISSKDIYVNFLVMVNYMTLVFKCQRLCLS